MRRPGGGDRHSQSAKSAEKGGAASSHRDDAGKKVKGKKRHAIADTLGLMLNVSATPANARYRDGCLPLLKDARGGSGLKRQFAGGGYSGDESRGLGRSPSVEIFPIMRKSSAF